jgi:hypothetical protein
MRRALHVFAIIAIGFVAVIGRADDNSTSSEFTIRAQYMHSRVEDFYTRLNEQDRAEEQRERDGQQMAEQRKKRAEAYEHAREEFVKNRKPPPPPDDSRYEAELKERARLREKQREEFVRRRDEFRREEAKFDTIPEEDEVGIDDLYDADQNSGPDKSHDRTPPGHVETEGSDDDL